MKRLLSIGTPSARQYNRLIDAINLCGRGQVSYAGVRNAPMVYKTLEMQEVWHHNQYLVYHGTLLDPNHGWYRARYGLPTLGVRNDTVVSAYSHAAELRQYARHGNLPSFPGYGYVNQINCQASNLLYADALNVIDVTTGNRFLGYDEGGQPMFEFGDWFGNDPYYAAPEDRVVLPWYHEPGGGENWISTGHHQGFACDHQGVFVSAKCDWMMVDVGGGQQGPMTGGTLWGDGADNNGKFNDWPFADWGVVPGKFAGSLGGGGSIGNVPPVEWLGQWSHWPPWSGIWADGGIAFGLPGILKGPPATVLDAWIELKISGLETYRSTVLTTVSEGGATDTQIESESSQFDEMGIALIGGKVIDTTLGTMQWDILSGSIGLRPGQTAASGLWRVYDIKDIVQFMVTHQRGLSRYFAFALVPVPYSLALAAVENARGLLMSLMPTITYDYYADPGNTSPYYTGGDFHYVKRSSGQYVAWTSLERGNGYVSAQLPDGVHVRERLVNFLPPMGA